jgi:hypothetical protein
VDLGDTIITPRGPIRVRDAYASFVDAALELPPVSGMPEHVRPLVEMVRESTATVLGGFLPQKHPITGRRLARSGVAKFRIDGSVVLSSSFTSRHFYDQLMSIVGLLRVGKKITLQRSSSPHFYSAYRCFAEKQFGWTACGQVPERNRELLEMLRKQVIVLFGGALPLDHPVTKARLKGTTLDRFLRTGVLSLYNNYNGKKFYDDLMSIMRLRREGDAFIDGGELPDNFTHAFAETMAEAQGWKPLKEVEPAIAPLLSMVRRQILHLFWGKTFVNHPLTGRTVYPATFALFVKDGVMEFGGVYTAELFRRDLENLLTLERRGMTYTACAALPNDFINAYTDCLAHLNGWCDINDIPIRRRGFVTMVRRHVVAQFDGKLPSQHPITGKDWHVVSVAELCATGDINLSHVPEKVLRAKIIMVMGLVKGPKGHQRSRQHWQPYKAEYNNFLRDKYGWQPLDSIPPHSRELVRMLRHAVETYFHLRLPKKHPVTGDDMTSAEIRRLIETGRATFNGGNTPKAFYENMLSILRLRRERGAFVMDDGIPYGFDDAHEEFVHGKFQWVPVGSLDPRKRALVRMVRAHIMAVFKGKLPAILPVYDVELEGSSIDAFVETGNIEATAYSFETLRRHLREILSLEEGADGFVATREIPPEFDEYFNSYVEGMNEWVPIGELASHMQPLVSFVRQRVTDVFGGALPMYHPVTNKRTDETPVRGLMQGGIIVFHGVYQPFRFHEDLSATVNVRREDDGMVVKDTSFQRELDAIYAPFIAHEMKWRPMEEIPEQNRPLVMAARKELIKLFGGKFPKNHPLDGRTMLLSFLERFIVNGELEFNPRYTIDHLISDLSTYVFGVQRSGTRKVMRNKALSRSVQQMILQFKEAHSRSG